MDSKKSTVTIVILRVALVRHVLVPIHARCHPQLTAIFSSAGVVSLAADFDAGSRAAGPSDFRFDDFFSLNHEKESMISMMLKRPYADAAIWSFCVVSSWIQIYSSTTAE